MEESWENPRENGGFHKKNIMGVRPTRWLISGKIPIEFGGQTGGTPIYGHLYVGSMEISPVTLMSSMTFTQNSPVRQWLEAWAILILEPTEAQSSRREPTQMV